MIYSRRVSINKFVSASFNPFSFFKAFIFIAKTLKDRLCCFTSRLKQLYFIEMTLDRATFRTHLEAIKNCQGISL